MRFLLRQAVTPKSPVTANTNGQLRASKKQRHVFLAKFEHSRMSAAQFAQRAGLKYSTFAAWAQGYRRVKRPDRKLVILGCAVDIMGLEDIKEYIVNSVGIYTISPVNDQSSLCDGSVNHGSGIRTQSIPEIG